MMRRIAVLMLVAALVVALVVDVAVAKKGGKGKGKGKGKEKITICHNAGQENQQTITIAKPAWKAHEAHGDTLGPCPPLPPPPPPI